MIKSTCAAGFGCEHPGTISPEQRQEYSVSAGFPPLCSYIPNSPCSSFLSLHPIPPTYLSYLSGSFYLFRCTSPTANLLQPAAGTVQQSDPANRVP